MVGGGVVGGGVVGGAVVGGVVVGGGALVVGVVPPPHGAPLMVQFSGALYAPAPL